jgi:sialidase-1
MIVIRACVFRKTRQRHGVSRSTWCAHRVDGLINNDRVVQLSTGRFIAPAAHNRFRLDATNAPDGKGLLLPLISDDAGKTWRESKTWWPLPVHAEGGLQEPGIIELKDGRLFCWSRSTVGCQWGSWSADQGDTWTLPQPTEFKSPKSPMSMKRIPSTGDLLAIWNDHSGRYPVPAYDLKTSWARSPLASAISRDETLTWQNHKLVESDADHGYCYTAIHFTDDDHVLLAYCNGGRDTGGWVLARTIVRRIPLKWFYSR